MRPLLRRRERDEDGAVAIMVGILAVLLFSCAAIAVDLGAAWARRGQLQSQVDVAALATGDLLPATTPAARTAVATRAASYLNRAGNRVTGQPTVTAAELVDGSAANGELAFSTDGQKVTLTAPSAKVDFTFAGAVGLGSSTRVAAAATVGVFSEIPRSTSIVPFFLPSGCALGPADADTTNGGTSTSGSGSTATAGSGVVSGGAFNSTSQPDTANRYEGPKTLTFRVTGVSALKSTKDPVVQFQKTDDASVRWAVPGTWTNTSGDQNWEFTAVIGASDVTALSGQWRYQTIGTARTGNNSVVSYEQNFNVQPGSGTPPPATVCATGQSRGNFGQIDSPRDPALTNQANLAANMAEGLDHQLTLRSNAPADECTSPARVGEQLDDVSRDGNNCIKADSGNDGPAIADGLVKGTGSYLGRLNVQRGATRQGCNGGNTTIGGVSTNNDLLSCFMVGQTTAISTLTQPAPSTGSVTPVLDPAVTRSPRFVWLPVVYRTDRSSKNFQPIKRFVPAFITDETGTSTRQSPNATSDNGLTCNGNRSQCNSISAMKVFTFDPSWLPNDQRAPVTAYDASGRSVWRLVG